MIAVEVSDRGGERRAFHAESGQRLLQAGLAAGLGLPHECGTGTCGNCKVTVLRGDVIRLWPKAPAARFLRHPNETLLCQSAVTNGPVELALRGAFTTPCDPPCGLTVGKLMATRTLTPDVSLFSVALRKPIPYKPGQFVLLSGLGIEGPRAYSMTRHEPEKAELSFLIRKDPAGAFTKTLFDNPEVSRDISVFGPMGRAIFLCSEDRPFVAIAGGSGIAGILAILHHAAEGGHFRKHVSHLFFGLRDVSNVFLLDELSSAVAQSAGKLQVTIAFSDSPCTTDFAARYASLRFAKGFVHEVACDALVAGDEQRTTNPLFFVAGPPVMVNATMRMLIGECKISPAEIRYDRFG